MKKIYYSILAIGLLFTANGNVAAAEKPFADAVWIGAAGEDLPLYPDYLPVFEIEAELTLKQDGEAALIYGAEDPRLMNRNLNIYNLENAVGRSGIRVSFDNKNKTISVYRYGYHPDDKADTPIATFKSDKLHTGTNKIAIRSNLGYTDVFVNDEKAGSLGLNPVGNGGDYLAFPVLAKLGVDIKPGTAKFSNIRIKNFREPGNTLHSINDTFDTTQRIVIDPKALPELRTVFDIPADKAIEQAVVTATARGIYDLYINGKRVSDDYFYPGSTQYNKTHLYHTFDVRPYLHPGSNEIIARLGEGWWSGGATFVGENWNFYGDRQSFIANLISIMPTGLPSLSRHRRNHGHTAATGRCCKVVSSKEKSTMHHEKKLQTENGNRQ